MSDEQKIQELATLFEQAGAAHREPFRGHRALPPSELRQGCRLRWTGQP